MSLVRLRFVFRKRKVRSVVDGDYVEKHVIVVLGGFLLPQEFQCLQRNWSDLGGCRAILSKFSHPTPKLKGWQLIVLQMFAMFCPVLMPIPTSKASPSATLWGNFGLEPLPHSKHRHRWPVCRNFLDRWKQPMAPCQESGRLAPSNTLSGCREMVRLLRAPPALKLHILSLKCWGPLSKKNQTPKFIYWCDFRSLTQELGGRKGVDESLEVRKLTSSNIAPKKRTYLVGNSSSNISTPSWFTIYIRLQGVYCLKSF